MSLLSLFEMTRLLELAAERPLAYCYSILSPRFKRYLLAYNGSTILYVYIALVRESQEGSSDVMATFSADLVRYISLATESSISFLTLFTRPYRLTEDVELYKTTLLITSEFGIAILILYLKKMIHVSTSYISLRSIPANKVESVIMAEELLNNLLSDDILDKGYIGQMFPKSLYLYDTD
ncbi:uncharacterized protein N7498_006379 [Penicillium cinerascens]|uniref:Uncharacterized protein n=1 Tax=Penicillium cinerascens TaxID=70096 RepID=A0A9W9MI44_9EURO|nr:uncharacterized protein N7498_006379 [Penicillium cinerascens]KAJ5201716.1 hypothetical protein N7498_006379 [Penicillium cinerascens]